MTTKPGLNSKDFNPFGLDMKPTGFDAMSQIANSGGTTEAFPYQVPMGGLDLNVSEANSSPFTGVSNPVKRESLGDQDYISTFDQYPAPTYSPNIDSGAFQGFDKAQMKTDGSFASIGAGVGALAGGPVGSAVGAVGGTAVDMYLSYQANEERKKADRQRLEEARRQQQYAQKQSARDRALAASQYEDTMGFRNAQEGRVQEGFEVDMKQKRLNMLRDAMNNSMQNNDTVRSIFAKRGVI
tara:strand:+ start:20320 stop:21039 length:720 start_codon:yes stop_codon:yes gene_type:complete